MPSSTCRVEAIQNLAKIELPISEDLQQILEERLYNSSAEEISEEAEFDGSTYYAY